MIKRLFTLALICATTFTIAQEKNSLLWKISGNGLKKDSYLFGTMHVSEKIAFHLDDVFFESIMKSDFVALESDPDLWLDNIFDENEIYGQFNMFSSTRSNNFYNTSFELNEPKQQELMFFISRDDMLLNGVLFRTNQNMQNFQEETYLDMFIYQTGRKFGKKIYSLEDLKKSSYLVKKAAGDARKEKPDLWLQKRFKKESFYEIMNNAYRDRDIFLLDSLNTGMYSKHYLDNMLYIRNEEMADNIDKIAQKGSLFSAIGAAHLAGKKGVINMLREKGYTVTPLLSDKTEKGKAMKTKIEDKVVETEYLSQTSSDGFFTVSVPNKLYELNLLNNTTYLCPDLANGSFVSITRISTFDYLHQGSENTIDFDKILIESIPGEIITKEEITKQGFKGLDIVNKTKTGNFQRYQIFFTPIEMLIFKMGGKKDFIKNHGSTFFDSIYFNNLGSETINVSPTHGGFEVAIPKYHSFTNKANYGNRLLQSVDKDGNYYFVKEVILNDVNYIEEDSFELERIQERFYKNLELEYNGGSFTDSSKTSFTSTSKLKKVKDVYVHLKTYTNAGHYYLLGYISKNDQPNASFFNSFKFKNFRYKEKDFKIQKDTSLYFSVKSTVKPSFRNYYTKYAKKNNKDYESFNRRASYISRGNEEVFVKLNKKHDFTSYANIDSLWSDVTYKKWFNKYAISKSESYNLLKNFLKNRSFKVTNKERGTDKNGYPYYSYLLKDSLSSKAVKVKKILSNGAIYELKALIDTTKGLSDFMSNFYETFKPKDSIIGKPLFVDKTSLFFEALKNKDSIALDGYNYVNFEKKDAKDIMKVVKNYKFEDNQLKIKEYLIKRLGRFKTKKTQRFLEDLYTKSFENPNNQIAILRGLGDDRNEVSYQKILKLLESDIPLTSKSYDVSNMINRFGDSLALAKKLFPDLLTYATIDEYKSPIYEMLAEILEKGLIDPSIYIVFKKQILTEAKIELKRQLSKKINSSTGTSYGRYNDKGYDEDDLLNIYVKLLFPFRKDKNVQSFLYNLKLTDNYFVKTSYLVSKIKSKEKYDKSIFNDLVSKLNSRGVLYTSLDKINRTDLFPKKYKTKKEVYKAILFDNEMNEKLKDSLVFLEIRDFKIATKTYEVYFFKSKPHKNSKSYNKDWKLNYIAFEKKGTQIFVKPYHKETSEKLDETKPIEEILDISIEKIKLEGRKRVNLSSRRSRGLF
ncbi:MAG: TraB/GumN family protein [Flavobacteriaceae bacterium]